MTLVRENASLSKQQSLIRGTEQITARAINKTAQEGGNHLWIKQMQNKLNIAEVDRLRDMHGKIVLPSVLNAIKKHILQVVFITLQRQK